MEGHGAAKRWIVSVEDIDTMYESFFEGQDIMLWCDMKKDVPSRKRNSDEDTGVAKRKKIEDSDSRIKEELKQKHPDMQLTDPQFALWARLIRRGLHDSYETPPNIPLLAGNTKNKSTKKSSETEGGELGKALSGVLLLWLVLQGHQCILLRNHAQSHKAYLLTIVLICVVVALRIQINFTIYMKTMSSTVLSLKSRKKLYCGTCITFELPYHNFAQHIYIYIYIYTHTHTHTHKHNINISISCICYPTLTVILCDACKTH